MRNPHSLSMQFAALVKKEVNQLYSKDSQLVLNAKQNNEINIIYQVKVIYSLGPLTITAGNVKQFCWKIAQSSCGDLFLQNDNLKRVDC